MNINEIQQHLQGYDDAMMIRLEEALNRGEQWAVNIYFNLRFLNQDKPAYETKIEEPEMKLKGMMTKAGYVTG